MINSKGLVNKKNANTIKWEQHSEVPTVCNNCLGDNPYLRMIKSEYSKECKFCFRPFTLFKWTLSKNNKCYKTEICSLCSKIKNACQSCGLDLTFGVELETRDQFLSNNKRIDIPKETQNRDFWIYKMSQKIDNIELPYNNKKNYSFYENINKDKTEQISLNNKNNDLSLKETDNTSNIINCEVLSKDLIKEDSNKTNEKLDDLNLIKNDNYKNIVNNNIQKDCIVKHLSPNKTNVSRKRKKLENSAVGIIFNKHEYIKDLDENANNNNNNSNKTFKNKKEGNYLKNQDLSVKFSKFLIN